MYFKWLFYLYMLKYASAQLNLELANTAFNQQLYKDVLDAEECERQVTFLRSNFILALQFADAGIRLPRGLLNGNTVDLGNYHQCLGINYSIQDMDIQGKYCAIQVPMNQTFYLPEGIEWSEWGQLNELKDDAEFIRKIEDYDRLRTQIQMLTGTFERNDVSRTLPVGPFAGVVLRLATCIPKPCTTQQAMTSLLFNLSAVGFEYEDNYCRLPDDKPWVAADYITIAVFSLIGILTLISTCYDLYCTFCLKMDRKELNVMHTSFSVYTNGKSIMNFQSGPGSLQCLDGIRSLAMIWVILGHAFGSEKFMSNIFDIFDWMISLKALWITSAPITVDTFFTIAGVLLVYTSVGKMNGMSLLKNLHLFYLNRLVRMFPLLATVVLLQASYFHRILDGPAWTTVPVLTHYCRTYWWTTLLHVQNLLNTTNQCIAHSWYIAIDIQLYIVSPLILYWVLNGKKITAWVALILGLLVPLTVATIYNFINNFPGGSVALSRSEELEDFMNNYYFFTVTRAPPFFVGMIFGYVLHLCRNEKVKMHWFLVIFMWICSLTVTTTIFFSTYYIKQLDWDNQLVDNLINSFMRPAWGAALCWIIFACHHGYGGPINWLLTLDIWKLPSRLSYAMFLFHYPLMFSIGDAAIAPTYFSIPRLIFVFFAHLVVAFIVAYLATLLIDSPFSIIFKQLLTSKPSKHKNPSARKQLNEDKEKAEPWEEIKNVNEPNGRNQSEAKHVNDFAIGTKDAPSKIENETNNVIANGSIADKTLIVVHDFDENESNEINNSSKPKDAENMSTSSVNVINDGTQNVKDTDNKKNKVDIPDKNPT